MADAEQPPNGEGEGTCGMGLAQHAAIPAKMAELLSALAETLKTHIPTIDGSGAAGQAERDAYTELSRDYAELARRLGAAAERMRSYGGLPAAPHHEEALADPALVETFARFVAVEAELAASLRRSADADGKLLRGFQEPGS